MLKREFCPEILFRAQFFELKKFKIWAAPYYEYCMILFLHCFVKPPFPEIIIIKKKKKNLKNVFFCHFRRIIGFFWFVSQLELM